MGLHIYRTPKRGKIRGIIYNLSSKQEKLIKSGKFEVKVRVRKNVAGKHITTIKLVRKSML